MNVKFQKMMTPKCNDCGKRYPIGNTNGMPNMVGFQLEDGQVLNLCYKCLIKMGAMSEEEKDKYFKDLGVDE